MSKEASRPVLIIKRPKPDTITQPETPQYDSQAYQEPHATQSPPQPPSGGASLILQCFRKHWPVLFPEGPLVPLQIGILEDITLHLQRAGEPFDKKQISKALATHCHRLAYLKALTKAPCRIGLNGEQTAISDHDRARAQERLIALKAHINAKEKNGKGCGTPET